MTSLPLDSREGLLLLQVVLKVIRVLLVVTLRAAVLDHLPLQDDTAGPPHGVLDQKIKQLMTHPWKVKFLEQGIPGLWKILLSRSH